MTQTPILLAEPDVQVFPLVTTHELASARHLYEDGQYLQAYEAARVFGPLDAWQEPDALVFAGRLASQLGAGKLGNELIVRAWRRNPRLPEALWFYAYRLLRRRGPLRALRFLAQWDEVTHASPLWRGRWLALKAQVLAHIRDFEAAEALQTEAGQYAPEDPWVQTDRAELYKLEDRYAEALTAARAALALRAWYRPAVQALAGLLMLDNRDQEALELLEEGAWRVESGSVVVQLVDLQTHLGLYAEARENVERYALLTPLREPGAREWLYEQRAETAYHCGDYDNALRWAEQCDSSFQQGIAQRMREEAGHGRRVLLPVGFVRQHHMTCAPATLAALSRYWQRDAEHLSLAEEICYDGTPAASERRWATANGWAVREFKVTWETAKALLDKGIPFTLTTVEPGSAHLQSVVGYDERRGTLLIRDPYERDVGETHAAQMLAHYRSGGPRGMALVPSDQAQLFDDIDFADAAQYDQLYAVQTALGAYERQRAASLVAEMKARWAGHRLVWQAQMALAGYDNNQEEFLAAIEGLLALFPEDINYQLNKLSVLQNLARREERLEVLEKLCRQPRTDPLLWQQYAVELARDGRHESKARRWLLRAHRCRPLEADNYYFLASHLWRKRHFDEALQLYRWAACLENKKEGYVRAYFTAARQRQRTPEALAMLRQRFALWGARAGEPAMTLFEALRQLDRDSEAFGVLAEALRRRPGDGELKLFAAECYTQAGKFVEARGWLSQAHGQVAEVAWLHTAAQTELLSGKPAAALALWRKVAELTPLNTHAQSCIAELLAETKGDAAALEHLEQAAKRFPFCLDLQKLRIQWQHDDDAAAESALRGLLQNDNADAWAHRELAVTLARQRRWDDALEASAHALALGANNAVSHLVHGQILVAGGRIAEGQAALRQSVALSVDTEGAIGKYIGAGRNGAERQAALHFVLEQLRQQVTLGDALQAFYEEARGLLAPDELLSALRELWSARQDLWQSWSCVAQQLLDMQRAPEALDIIRQATARFPQVAPLWLLAARTRQTQGQVPEEIAALEQALLAAPRWTMALQQLADAYERAGDVAQARSLLERAVLQVPREFTVHGFLADLLWRSSEQERAVTHIRRALELNHEYEWAWNTLSEWAAELQQPDLANQMARDVTQRRPQDVRAWIRLAQTLDPARDFPEQMSALNQAVALNPRSVDARTCRIRLLASQEKYAQALAAARERVWGDYIPAEMRYLEAWLEVETGHEQSGWQRMVALTQEEPDYLPAWRKLAQWYQNLKDAEGFLRATQTMVNLAPHDPALLAQLGEARCAVNDFAGARQVLRQAINLAPDYARAGEQLFDLQLEEGDCNAALDTLEHLSRYVKPPLTQTRRVRLALRNQDYQAAGAHLAGLCAMPFATDWYLETVLEDFSRAQMLPQARDVLAQAMSRADANPRLAPFWVQACIYLSQAELVGPGLASGNIPDTAWQEAARTFLDYLAEQSDQAQFNYFTDFHATRLHPDVSSCAVILGICNRFGDYARAAEWGQGWATRPDATADLLWKYAYALRLLDRQPEAHAASRQAVSLPGSEGREYHILALAFDEVLAGNLVAARSLLAQTPAAHEAAPWFTGVHRMSLLLLGLAGNSDGAVLVGRLVAISADIPECWEYRLLNKMFHQAVDRVLDVAGGKMLRAKTWWRLRQARGQAQKILHEKNANHG